MAFTLTTAYTWTSGEVDTATKRNTAGIPTLADGQTYGFGLGSAAAPSMAFTGDSNTGAYSPGADQWAVAVSGAQVVLVSTTGVAITGSLAISSASTSSTLTSTTGTNQVNDLFVNTGGSYFWGVDNSTGGALGLGVAYEFGCNIPAGRGLSVYVAGTGTVARFSASGAAFAGAFGANGATPQGKYASGGLLAGVVAALIANGILSS